MLGNITIQNGNANIGKTTAVKSVQVGGGCVKGNGGFHHPVSDQHVDHPDLGSVRKHQGAGTDSGPVPEHQLERHRGPAGSVDDLLHERPVALQQRLCTDTILQLHLLCHRQHGHHHARLAQLQRLHPRARDPGDHLPLLLRPPLRSRVRSPADDGGERTRRCVWPSRDASGAILKSLPRRVRRAMRAGSLSLGRRPGNPRRLFREEADRGWRTSAGRSGARPTFVRLHVRGRGR